MPISNRSFATVAGAIAAVVLAPAAIAQTSFNANLASPPGVYFGGGNFNGAFAETNGSLGNGITAEIGLRAGIRFVGPVTPLFGGTSYTNVYDVPTGSVSGKALWNYEFSVHLSGGTLANLAANYTTALNVTGPLGSFSFNPAAIADNASVDALGVVHHNAAGAPGGDVGFQNSENLDFSVGAMPFDHNANGEYTFALSITPKAGTTGGLALRDGIIVDAPEPATMALLGIGLFGLGIVRRRR